MKLARSLPREDLRGVADSLRAKLEEFKSYLGIISCICNPGMRGRHWQAISKHADFKVAPSDEESLHNLLQHNLHKFEKELQDISDAATREHALEKQLDNMQAAWVCSTFLVRKSPVLPRHLRVQSCAVHNQARCLQQ